MIRKGKINGKNDQGWSCACSGDGAVEESVMDKRESAVLQIRFVFTMHCCFVPMVFYVFKLVGTYRTHTVLFAPFFLCSALLRFCVACPAHYAVSFVVLHSFPTASRHVLAVPCAETSLHLLFTDHFCWSFKKKRKQKQTNGRAAHKHLAGSHTLEYLVHQRAQELQKEFCARSRIGWGPRAEHLPDRSVPSVHLPAAPAHIRAINHTTHTAAACAVHPRHLPCHSGVPAHLIDRLPLVPHQNIKHTGTHARAQLHAVVHAA